MLPRPLKFWHLLLIPYAMFTGMGYGWLAYHMVRDREPWFTLLMLAGLGFTVVFITWLGGIESDYAAWVFTGAAVLYALLRLLFGRHGSLEAFVLPHVLAVVVLFAWPVYGRIASTLMSPAKDVRERER